MPARRGPRGRFPSARSQRSRQMAAYWRQVRVVQAAHPTATVAHARATVRSLRARDIRTAAETRRHPRILASTLRDVRRLTARQDRREGRPRPRIEREPAGTGPYDSGAAPSGDLDDYADLDDWINAWNSWEDNAGYDEYDIETSADYGSYQK